MKCICGASVPLNSSSSGGSDRPEECGGVQVKLTSIEEARLFELQARPSTVAEADILRREARQRQFAGWRYAWTSPKDVGEPLTDEESEELDRLYDKRDRSAAVSYELTEAMIKYGGRFVVGLAHCLRSANSMNEEKIHATWPEYIETYTKLAISERNGSAGWPGSGDGSDDLADHNANEQDDYRDE